VAAAPARRAIERSRRRRVVCDAGPR